MTVATSRSAAAGTVTRTLAGGLDLLALHEAAPGRYPYLLESVRCDGGGHRYDLLFAVTGRETLDPAAPLASLNAVFERQRRAAEPSPWPFSGGWFLYLGYELAGLIEPSVRQARFDALPNVVMHRAPGVFLHDCRSGTVVALAEAGHEALLEQMLSDARAARYRRGKPAERLIHSLREDDPEQFIAAVHRAKAYIDAGDVYQANLSRQWGAEACPATAPGDVYRRLRDTNPAPFSGLARFDDDTAVISSSPERLIRVDGDTLSSRPIAGTRPRGVTRRNDAELTAELFASEKERAEHVMLIDLVRNDIGRVSRPGTVAVDEFMVLEPYRHVQHIVSNLRGTLRPDVLPGDIIAAVFPGGTITGCPKVRCMQIIAELEGTPRGPYTGSMGYLNRDGRLDLNILIRTLFMHRRRITLRAGAGIVADSVPAQELAETRAKARGLVLALDGDA